MTLTYWVAENKTDSKSYNIRRKTKKEVIEELQRRELHPITIEGVTEWFQHDGTRPQFGNPHKITVEYKDGFDLICQCLGEGGISETLY